MPSKNRICEGRDRPFRPERRAQGERAKRLAGLAVQRVEDYERRARVRTRRRRPHDQETFTATVEALALDALYQHFNSPGGWIAVPLSNQVLARKDRYRSPVLGKQLPGIVRALSRRSVGLLEFRRGVWGAGKQGRQSIIRASARLIALAEHEGINLADLRRDKPREVILLRGPKAKPGKSKGPLKTYDDTERTLRYREHLSAINQWLGQASISYEGDADTSERLLTRTFNNGSFEEGGRLNGGFWMSIGKDEGGRTGKEKRLAGLRINGEEVVELDFGQSGARIAYGMAGATLPEGDLYSIPRFPFAPDAPHFNREGIKKVFGAMLNVRKPLARLPQHTRRYFLPEDKAAYIVQRIREHHCRIAPLFFHGAGLRIMWLESEILVEVLLRGMGLGIVALPIHDALIVPRSRYDATRRLMVEVFGRLALVPGCVRASAYFPSPSGVGCVSTFPRATPAPSMPQLG